MASASLDWVIAACILARASSIPISVFVMSRLYPIGYIQTDRFDDDIGRVNFWPSFQIPITSGISPTMAPMPM